MANKRGKDKELVKDIMIMKFDKNLDQNLSGSGNQSNVHESSSVSDDEYRSPKKRVEG